MEASKHDLRHHDKAKAKGADYGLVQVDLRFSPSRVKRDYSTSRDFSFIL
jgi:hypothetical protein